MIRSPQICVEMNRLQLQLCIITAYQKVERRINYTGGNCQELVCDLCIWILLCAYVIRAEWPKEKYLNLTLATYTGSQVPIGKEGKTLSFLYSCLPEDWDVSAWLRSREGAREGGTVVCFHTSGLTQILLTTVSCPHIACIETLLKRRDVHLRGDVRTCV